MLSTRRRRTVTSCDTTAGSKRRRLLFTGDVDEMFMTRSLNVTPKTTEQHLIARSDKSVAYVTNNKRLRSTFRSIEAKLLTDTKHRAASLRQQSYLYACRIGLVGFWRFCCRPRRPDKIAEEGHEACFLYYHYTTRA